eukprot:COSAG01_NODE_44650_length_416_cov_88.044164_1_plen_21_part_10
MLLECESAAQAAVCFAFRRSA